MVHCVYVHAKIITMSLYVWALSPQLSQFLFITDTQCLPKIAKHLVIVMFEHEFSQAERKRPNALKIVLFALHI